MYRLCKREDFDFLTPSSNPCKTASTLTKSYFSKLQMYLSPTFIILQGHLYFENYEVGFDIYLIHDSA